MGSRSILTEPFIPLPAMRFLSLAALALCAAASSAGAQAKPDVEFAAGRPTSPLSNYVRVGETIYLSGKLGNVPGGGLAPGGVGPETKQTMENIKAELAKVGATMDDIVKCTVFLVDIKEWAAMNAEYTPFFTKAKPARSALAVAGLVNDARVEIECIAVKGAAATKQ